jgi:prepilin-type N-terminal cleavage/methylation domain-containing protein
MHDRYAPAKRIRGFTIMELVVVISCLGVLAAFAYPHFAMVEVEARKALVLSLGGSVNAAASQAHFLWLLQDRPATIDMEGQTITMVNGYPDEDDINNTLMDYHLRRCCCGPKARGCRFQLRLLKHHFWPITGSGEIASSLALCV